MTRKALVAAAALALLVTAFVSCGPDTSGLPDGLYAAIETEKGDIVIQLEPDRAPLTTMNFVGLAEGSIDSNADGEPFYDGLTFHRVEPGFVIQGGDPEGRGSGGPGYRFPTETHPDLLHDAPGVVAMANSGPDTNGSQFYVTMSATPHLDGGYNVFGRVIRGMDVVGEIEVGDVMRKVEIVRVGTVAEGYQASNERFQQLITQVAERRAAAAAARLREAEQVIAERWPAAMTVGSSNLRLDQTVRGTGENPAQGATVSIHFTFELLDGTQVDDTRARGEPYTFVFGEERLLPGLEMAIGEMQEGGSATAIIPPDLAFGATGAPPVVEPNSYVVFRLELISVE